MKTNQHRWWAYALAALGGIVVLAAALYVTLILLYTSKEPMPLNRVEITQEDRDALITRWTEFQGTVEAGHPSPPFRISGREMNVFFSMLPRFADTVHLSVAEDRIRTEFSMPLDELLPGFRRGRYLNGEDTAVLKPNRTAMPDLQILSATINGRKLPRWLLRRLSRVELYRDVFFPLESREFLKRIHSIEVRDGFVVITPVEEL